MFRIGALLLVFGLLATRATGARADELLTEERACPPEGCGVKQHAVTGLFLGVDAGYTWVDDVAADRLSISRPIPMTFRLGLELWDQSVFAIGYGGHFFRDDAPITELVVDCQTTNGVTTSCSDEPREEESRVQGDYMIFEAGYQPQFELKQRLRLAPGALVGYQKSIGAIERAVICEGCPEGQELDFDASAPYLAASLQLSFADQFGFAVVLRSQWYFASDLRVAATCGLGFYVH